MSNKKISELSRTDALLGDELFPFAKDGGNGAATADTIREFVEQGLDKMDWSQPVIECYFSQNFSTGEINTNIIDTLFIHNAIPKLLESEAILCMAVQFNLAINVNGVDVQRTVVKSVPVNYLHGQDAIELELGVVEVQSSELGTLAEVTFTPVTITQESTSTTTASIDYKFLSEANFTNDDDYKLTNLPSIDVLNQEWLKTNGSNANNTGVNAMLLNLSTSSASLVDSMEFVTFSQRQYTRQSLSILWDYIKSHITTDGYALSTEVAASKLALFIDMWTAAWGQYGKYDPDAAPDAAHPFFGNEIWMTYEEALLVLQFGDFASAQNLFDCAAHSLSESAPQIKTTLPSVTSDKKQWPVTNMVPASLQTIRFGIVSPTHKPYFEISGNFLFQNNLRAVYDLLVPTKAIEVGSYNPVSSLEVIYIHALQYNIHLKLPRLSLASLRYLVDNAANTAAITVTVHPDVYAKLSGDTTNEAASSLTADELALWQQLLTDATEKQINFATPE